MTRTLIHGAALALLAAGMSGNAAAQLHNTGPTTPCTEANDGQFESIEHRPPGGGGGYVYTYRCNAGYWELWSRCGGASGCIYY